MAISIHSSAYSITLLQEIARCANGFTFFSTLFETARNLILVVWCGCNRQQLFEECCHYYRRGPEVEVEVEVEVEESRINLRQKRRLSLLSHHSEVITIYTKENITLHWEMSV